MSNTLSICLYSCLFILLACAKPYNPPEINIDRDFLVVDGIINGGPGATTTISLSSSQRLTDTVLNIPQTSAKIQIAEEGSSILHPLQEQQPGMYTSSALSLNQAKKYRLEITTKNNKQYISDWITIKSAPIIDSVYWLQDNDVGIYLNTDDPQNNTRYYRWNFVETWEYHSFYVSHLGYRDGQVIFRDPADYQKVCWSTASSSKIILGSTVHLTEDVIHKAPITVIPNGSNKIGIKYSILVKQYTLSEEAFQYWQVLQKNTEQQGSIFDAQPSQLKGNLYSVSNPDEPVIGYISASTIEEKRIYIKKSELINWQLTEPGNLCDPQVIQRDQASLYLSSGLFAPAYFITGGGLAIAKKECVDCMVKGGTNIKPAFWQ